MRWPLRNQILGPVLLLLFATVGVLTGWNFLIASGIHQQRVEQNLREVSQFLSQASFPLNPSVLRDMKSLSGADFLLLGADLRVVASTLQPPPPLRVREQLSKQKPVVGDVDGIGPAIQIAQANYYHRQVPRQRESFGGPPTQLHLLLREDSYRQLWWRSVWPSMLVGLVALPVVAVVAAGMASLVTRPLGRLRHQVDRVAGGHWEYLDLGDRNDEIRDLSEAVNRMTEQLTAYEAEVRKKERLETLVDLGSGIAHHLRNAATGCRMAIQLSQMHRQLPAETRENLQVSLRQLALMDKYIQRFLSLDDRAPSGRGEGVTDWVAVCREVLELLRPSAQHLGVCLEERLPESETALVAVPQDDLEQILMNLVTNALDAAAENPPGEEELSGKPKVTVDFTVDYPFGILRVWDSGSGPPADIQEHLFDSFVTRKRNGVGLGLYLTRQIALRHQGSVDWQRTDNPPGTRFEVRLPLSSDDDESVDRAERAPVGDTPFEPLP